MPWTDEDRPQKIKARTLFLCVLCIRRISMVSAAWSPLWFIPWPFQPMKLGNMCGARPPGEWQMQNRSLVGCEQPNNFEKAACTGAFLLVFPPQPPKAATKAILENALVLQSKTFTKGIKLTWWLPHIPPLPGDSSLKTYICSILLFYLKQGNLNLGYYNWL